MASSKHRGTNEINAGSMADIAFLLLIFFLVTTTMDAETGIARILPPVVEDTTTHRVPGRNVLEVLVNANNQLLVEGKLTEVGELKSKAKEFIKGYQGSDDYPEYPKFKVSKSEEVQKYFGPNYEVSEQVVSLKNDRGTSYETYIAVQNALTAAYNELRNELSVEKFGAGLKELEKDARNADKVKAIKNIYPMRISEANPN